MEFFSSISLSHNHLGLQKLKLINLKRERESTISPRKTGWISLKTPISSKHWAK
jgi:hypothetical protein